MRWLFVAVVALNLLYLLAFVLTDDRETLFSDRGRVAAFPETLSFVGAEQLADFDSLVSKGSDVEGCAAIGPLSKEEEALALNERLGVAGYESSITKTEGPAEAMYWVYIPPLEGRAQALRKLREMHVAGIDSFVITSGPDQNAISVGLFSVRDSALGVQARLRAAGYPVQVRERARQGISYWVVLHKAAQGFLELLPEEHRHGSVTYRSCQTH